VDVVPDLDGFAAAQARLREQVGVDVTFLGEVSATFPPGTPLDDDTGQPYDALIEPTASAQASAVVRCDVAHRPLRNETDESQAGWGEHNHVMLIGPAASATALASAVAFRLRDHSYKITGLRVDAPVRGGDRLLVFGRGEGA
jgi:hypothetical protein